MRFKSWFVLRAFSEAACACVAVLDMEHSDLVGEAIATEEAEYIRAYVFDAIALQVRCSEQVGFELSCKGSLTLYLLYCASRMSVLLSILLLGRK